MNEAQGLRLPGRQATPSPGRFSRKDGLEHGLACFVEKYRPTYQPNRDLGSCSFSESIAWSRRAGAVYGARMSTPGSEPRRRRRVASHIFPARRGLMQRRSRGLRDPRSRSESVSFGAIVQSSAGPWGYPRRATQESSFLSGNQRSSSDARRVTIWRASFL